MPRKESREEYNARMRVYMLARYYRRREAAIVALGGKCVDCASVTDLEFDHDTPPKKGFTLSKGLSAWSETRIQAEIAKCVLRCKPCHQARTNRQLSVWHAKEHNPAAKLNMPLVRVLRARWIAGERAAALAREAGVSKPTMMSALRGITWAEDAITPP